MLLINLLRELFCETRDLRCQVAAKYLAMLRKLAAATQVERTVGYEHQCEGSGPRRNVEISDTLTFMRPLHFRYARLEIRVMSPSYISRRVSSARVRVTADASDFLRKALWRAYTRDGSRLSLFLIPLVFAIQRSFPKLSLHRVFLSHSISRRVSSAF